MRITKTAARVLGVLAIAAGCLIVAAPEAKAGYPYGGGYGGGFRPGYGGGFRPGYGGGHRPGYGGVYRPGGYNGGFIYNRPGDGLPPMPGHRVPGGVFVNRPGDGRPPVFIPRR